MIILIIQYFRALNLATNLSYIVEHYIFWEMSTKSCTAVAQGVQLGLSKYIIANLHRLLQLWNPLDGSDYSTVHQLSKLREVISTKPNKTRQNRVLNLVLLGVQRRHYLCAMRPHLLIEPKKRLK